MSANKLTKKRKSYKQTKINISSTPEKKQQVHDIANYLDMSITDIAYQGIYTHLLAQEGLMDVLKSIDRNLHTIANKNIDDIDEETLDKYINAVCDYILVTQRIINFLKTGVKDEEEDDNTQLNE
jgi:hypothetical protein